MRVPRFYKSISTVVIGSALLLAPPKIVADEGFVDVRIMTFNAEILAAPGVRAGTLQRYRFTAGRQAHCERIAGIVEALQPDILNLVEVTSKQAVDLLVEILHEKGLTDYRGYHVESHDDFTGMDVALISRYEPDLIDGKPIRNFYSDDNSPTWREKFTFTGRNGKPTTLETPLRRHSVYYVTVGGHRLGFVGLHLKSNPQDEYSNARRGAEARIAMRIVEQQVIERGYLPVILGDLNDYDADVPDRDTTRDPETNVLQMLKECDATRDGPELFNVASHIVRQQDRYTSHWDRNENGAADSDDVYSMLDYILLPVEFKPYVTRVVIARVLDLSTSDHFPVFVDLRLPRK